MEDGENMHFAKAFTAMNVWLRRIRAGLRIDQMLLMAMRLQMTEDMYLQGGDWGQAQARPDNFECGHIRNFHTSCWLQNWKQR